MRWWAGHFVLEFVINSWRMNNCVWIYEMKYHMIFLDIHSNLFILHGLMFYRTHTMRSSLLASKQNHFEAWIIFMLSFRNCSSCTVWAVNLNFTIKYNALQRKVTFQHQNSIQTSQSKSSPRFFWEFIPRHRYVISISFTQFYLPLLDRQLKRKNNHICAK